jgi:hypothetical protein
VTKISLRVILILCLVIGVIASGAVAVAVWATVHVVHDDAQIARLTEAQRTGRRLALGVTCAFGSAISEAGRRTIGNAMPLPPGVEALLEAHGFPSFGERRAQAQIASNEYVAAISAAVERQVGRKGDGLVRPDGTLDCMRLQVVARAR